MEEIGESVVNGYANRHATIDPGIDDYLDSETDLLEQVVDGDELNYYNDGFTKSYRKNLDMLQSMNRKRGKGLLTKNNNSLQFSIENPAVASDTIKKIIRR